MSQEVSAAAHAATPGYSGAAHQAATAHYLATPHYPATQRCLLQPAPDGLALVQDLLNTRAIGRSGADLLGTVGSAREWLTDVLAAWSQSDDARGDWVQRLSDRDLAALRALRSEVAQLVADGSPAQPAAQTASATLTVMADGTVRLEPAGRGLRWFASAIWTEIFLAQRAGTWRRLKVCHNVPCSSTFFDRSKNNSGVWHDVKVCGNAVNLRASRARRRQAAQ